MIVLDGITKTFRKDFWAKAFVALDDVSFSINEGETIGFLGANGAGKTTSLKILFNFIKADQGQVRFSGIVGKNLSEALKHIGYLPERPYFYPHLTGHEFVEYIGKLHDIPLAQIRERALYWGKRFKIDHALNRMIRGYSKGMLQRIGFVAILVHNPSILILDEPLSGLDPVGRKEFKDVLRELARSGKTIFFSSHIVSDIEEVCKKVVVLEQGKLLYEGDIEQLIQNHESDSFEVKVKAFHPPQLWEGVELRESHQDIHILTAKGNIHQVLQQVMERPLEIISLNPLRPSLEQIIYKIRS